MRLPMQFAIGLAPIHTILGTDHFPSALAVRANTSVLFGVLDSNCWWQKRDPVSLPGGHLVLMAAPFIFYLLDGLNSVVHLYPGLDHLSLYQPNNIPPIIYGIGIWNSDQCYSLSSGRANSVERNFSLTGYPRT